MADDARDTSLGRFFGEAQAAEAEKASPPPELTEETKPAEIPEKETEVKANAEPEKPAEAQQEQKAEGDKPAESKPAFDWESDDNPYRKRAAEVEAQYKATRDWATGVESQNANFRKQLDIINKKLDGTYDPAVDDPRPDPEAVINQATIVGKVQASEAAAVEKYGRETVDKAVQRFDALFANNPMAQQRVYSSKSPIMEAMSVLKEYDIVQKYQTTNVDEIIEKIKTEAKAEQEKELTEKITKQVMDRLGGPKAPNGLRVARQATDESRPAQPRPLSSFFNN